MNEERLVSIETKIALQEDLLDELNKSIYQQQKRLEKLEAACEALARHISSVEKSVHEGRIAVSERPPHY